MKPIPLLLVAFTALLSGCATYNYNLAAKNTGNEAVWCSLVASSKGIAHVPGRLAPGASATFAGPFHFHTRINGPSLGKQPKDEQFEKGLDLTGKVPKVFQGRLIFIIDEDNDVPTQPSCSTGNKSTSPDEPSDKENKNNQILSRILNACDENEFSTFACPICGAKIEFLANPKKRSIYLRCEKSAAQWVCIRR